MTDILTYLRLSLTILRKWILATASQYGQTVLLPLFSCFLIKLKHALHCIGKCSGWVVPQRVSILQGHSMWYWNVLQWLYILFRSLHNECCWSGSPTSNWMTEVQCFILVQGLSISPSLCYSGRSIRPWILSRSLEILSSGIRLGESWLASVVA